MKSTSEDIMLHSPSDTVTGCVFCMVMMGSLGIRPFRAYRLIWYSVSGERSLTTTDVWPGPTYSSCLLLPVIMGIICTLYPVTSPIEASQVTRIDFDAVSRTWRLEAGSTTEKNQKWNYRIIWMSLWNNFPIKNKNSKKKHCTIVHCFLSVC